MPIAAADLDKDPFLRMLIMGHPKCGKSTTCISSLVDTFGPGYVICCGDKNSLAPAVRRTKKFQFDVVRGEDDMEACLKEGRTGAKEGRYKWALVDDFSLYASGLEGSLRDASAAANNGKPDGRRYWSEFKQRLLNVPRRMFDWKTHVVFISHFISQGGEIDGQRAKSGTGIVPMIGGAAREEFPAMFQDILFMEKEKDRRVFQVNPEGVWGPGSRSADGTHTIDASFSEFLKLVSSGAAEKAPPPKVVKK